ncbi:MAG: ferric reductase-like transmembrane domain-containing protein [Cyanobacteriota bacterium]|nr:ferric reductase-like transmembrane domain-containing protein [Cyanobacteriota bacterium]
MTVNAELVTGYFALIAYIATLLPSNFVVVFSTWKKAYSRRILLRNRRKLGIICFLFSSNHGVLALEGRNVDFLNLNTYIDYFTGLGSILIFAILAVTSNNWSNRKLGKNWKKLHLLTYVALILLILHLFLAKQGEWDWYTWCAFIALSTMTCLWLLRILIRR